MAILLNNLSNTFLTWCKRWLNELMMDWHKDLYVNKARNGFSKRLHDDGLNLFRSWL